MIPKTITEFNITEKFLVFIWQKRCPSFLKYLIFSSTGSSMNYFRWCGKSHMGKRVKIKLHIVNIVLAYSCHINSFKIFLWLLNVVVIVIIVYCYCFCYIITQFFIFVILSHNSLFLLYYHTILYFCYIITQFFIIFRGFLIGFCRVKRERGPVVHKHWGRRERGHVVHKHWSNLLQMMKYLELWYGRLIGFTEPENVVHIIFDLRFLSMSSKI